MNAKNGRAILDAALCDILSAGQDLDEVNLASLMTSLAQHGLLHPVGVYPCGSTAGKYAVAWGHHRIEAARRLGWSAITATILDPVGEAAELLMLKAHENACRRKVSDWEMSDDIRRYSRLTEVSLAVAGAGLYGLEAAAVSRLFTRVNRLAEDQRELVESGRVGSYKAYLIATVDSPQQRRELMAWAASDPPPTKAQIEARVKALKGTKARRVSSKHTKLAGTVDQLEFQVRFPAEQTTEQVIQKLASVLETLKKHKHLKPEGLAFLFG